MCAIAGMLGLPYDANILDALFRTMLHRGPDGTGSYMERECCLLHSRLAIIDPIGGAQPMSLHWGGEEYILTYNGELYNTQELRDTLTAMGHEFVTHSDTEVVLHAYAQWKEACVDRFNGIFAFGVWEKNRKRLFLARDRMGVKPLFYTRSYGGMLFASEIKTLLAYPNMQAELDVEGAAQILLLGPGRMPGSGVLKNIYELMPGCCGYYTRSGWKWWRYWKLRDREHKDSFEETAECVRYLVTDAIKRQMVSDVPIGTFLSGGLDSSLISAICAKEMNSQPLNTFSVDYENNDKYFVPGKFQPNSDGAYIAIMQQAIKSNHHLTVLKPDELIDALCAATAARDLPGMADVDISLLLFCKEIRKDVKMALSGECADEIFGGYPWYRDPEVRAYSGFPWAQNTRQRATFLNQDIAQTIDAESFVGDLYTATLAQCDILPETSPLERRMKEMVNLNQNWFMQTLLERKDRMSMACGLEVRVPFCDYRIAEYLYGVPWSFKDYQGKEKGLLRYAMEGILPNEVLWRKKSPYPKTYDPRYLDGVSRLLSDLLERNDAPIFGIVNRESLKGLLNQEFTWPWYGQLMKLPQTIAFMLQINCWLENYKVKIL